MSRPLMPKSGAMAPYIVVNRDAAVAGVFSVDGEAGAVVLTSKYLQISNYTIDKEELNTRLTGIDSSIQNNVEAIGNINTAIGSINSTLNTKAAKGANNDITELNALTKAITIAQGGTGSSTLEGAKTALELDRFSQEFETETRIYSGDKNSRLTIQNNGTWGVYSGTENKWLALPVEQGGTGVNNREALWDVVRPQGSTPLAGDPVNDYDAVTKRWVENKISTGTVGPTMNGVMNYGVGDFHLRDSRAYIQPYEVVSDGQLLNRADWPELWAYAQMTSPIEDADWLANPANRGKYSTGNGTTTFRVPDRNGVQTGSISGLYARGDGGNSANDGTVQQNAAPNITGTVGANIWSVYGEPTGAMFAAGPVADIPLGAVTTPAYYVGFQASRSNAAYGRDNTTEVRTNSFIGVWVIRASGGFVAANTSWSVINGDATEPANGVTAYGGAVRSVYNIAGAEAYVSQLRTKILFGTDFYSALEMKGQGGTLREVMSVNSVGAVTVPGRGGFFVGNTGEPNAIEFFNVTPSSEGNTYVNIIRGHWYDDRWEFGGIREGNTQFRAVQLNITRAIGGNKYWAFKWENSCIDTNLGLIQPGGSDRRLKDKITDITNTEGNTPRDRINHLVAREFEWLSDGRKDRGFIAQEAKEADEIYAFSGSMSGMLNLNDRAILADIVAVVQEQDRELAEVKAELAELRELVNLMVQK